MGDERKMPTYEELVAEQEPFIGPPQPPKMQMLLTDDEKQKIRDYAKQLVDDHMSKEAKRTSED